MANAATAGDTPNDIYYYSKLISYQAIRVATTRLKRSRNWGYGIAVRQTKTETRVTTYQISQRIQFLSHQTALFPPPRNLPIHEVEEQAKRHKRKRSPEITEGTRLAETIPHRRKDRHYATET
jgi:hypothetical protein